MLSSANNKLLIIKDKNVRNNKKTIGKSLISTILSNTPVLSIAKDFWDEIVSSQLQERRDKVLKEVIERITNLEEKDKIKEIPNFASILKTATRNAAEDVDENKIKYYVNSLVSVIKQENIDNIKIHIFLNSLKDCTLLHLEVLKYFKDPYKFYKNKHLEMNVSEPNEIFIQDIEKDYPKIVENKDLFKIAINDLYNKSLLKIGNIEDIIYARPLANNNYNSNVIEKQATNLGNEFLDFINFDNQ